jgi:hypothetical protein
LKKQQRPRPGNEESQSSQRLRTRSVSHMAKETLREALHVLETDDGELVLISPSPDAITDEEEVNKNEVLHNNLI